MDAPRLCLFAAAILMPFVAMAQEEGQAASQAGNNPKPKIEIIASAAVDRERLMWHKRRWADYWRQRKSGWSNQHLNAVHDSAR